VAKEKRVKIIVETEARGGPQAAAASAAQAGAVRGPDGRFMSAAQAAALSASYSLPGGVQHGFPVVPGSGHGPIGTWYGNVGLGGADPIKPRMGPLGIPVPGSGGGVVPGPGGFYPGMSPSSLIALPPAPAVPHNTTQSGAPSVATGGPVGGAAPSPTPGNVQYGFPPVQPGTGPRLTADQIARIASASGQTPELIQQMYAATGYNAAELRTGLAYLNSTRASGPVGSGRLHPGRALAESLFATTQAGAPSTATGGGAGGAPPPSGGGGVPPTDDDGGTQRGGFGGRFRRGRWTGDPWGRVGPVSGEDRVWQVTDYGVLSPAGELGDPGYPDTAYSRRRYGSKRGQERLGETESEAHARSVGTRALGRDTPAEAAMGDVLRGDFNRERASIRAKLDPENYGYRPKGRAAMEGDDAALLAMGNFERNRDIKRRVRELNPEMYREMYGEDAPWYKSPLAQRFFGGRPRGLFGLASLAGGSLIAGAVARSMRSNYEGVISGEVSNTDVFLGAAERLPILGEGIQLGRQMFGDVFSKERAVLGIQDVRQRASLEQNVQFIRQGGADQLQKIQFGQMDARAAAREAQAVSAGYDAAGTAFVNRPAVIGVRSASLGNLREEAMKTQAAADAARAGLPEFDVRIRSEQKALDKANADTRMWDAAANNSGQRLDRAKREALGLREATGAPPHQMVEDLQVAGGGALRGLGWAIGREWLWGGGPSSEVTERIEQFRVGQEAAATGAIRARQGAADIQARINDELRMKGQAQARVAELQGAARLAEINATKGEGLAKVRGLVEAREEGNVAMSMQPYGVQAAWLHSVEKMVGSGVETLGPADWHVLSLHPKSAEYMRNKQKRLSFSGERAGLELLGVAPGEAGEGIGAQRERMEGMEADIGRNKAEINKIMKTAVSDITDTTAKALSDGVKDVINKVIDNLRAEFGLQKRAEGAAQNRQGGGQ
jgi:hypothetical protein